MVFDVPHLFKSVRNNKTEKLEEYSNSCYGGEGLRGRVN